MFKNLLQIDYFEEFVDSFVEVKSLLWPGAPVENLLSQFVESIINYTCSNTTEAVQCLTPNSSQPPPATDNGVRDSESNSGDFPPPLHL